MKFVKKKTEHGNANCTAPTTVTRVTRFGNEIYLYTISTTLLKGFNDILLCILGLIVAPSKGKKLKIEAALRTHTKIF